MAIDNDALAAKLGKIFGALNEVNAFRGSTTTSRVATLRTEYSTDPLGLLAGLTDAKDATVSTLDATASYYSALVADTIVETVNADRLLPNKTLDAALPEWVRQLTNASKTFNDCPVTITVSNVGSPTADYTFVTTSKDGDGKATDFGIPDTYLVTVSADADRGGARWAETLALVGKASDGNVLRNGYPTGVGINTTFAVIDPDTDGGLVTDGSFNNYTSGAFDSWTRLPSTDAADSNRVADDYRNGSAGFALNLVSDGTNVPGVRQTIVMTASTRYAVHFAVKSVSAALTTAKVHVSVRRADTGAVVADAAGTNLTVSSGTMNAIGVGSWAKYTAVFCAPKYIPTAGLYLDIRLADGTTVTTAATANTAAYVDHVAVHELTPLYSRGIAFAVYSGRTAPLVTDQWQIAVALASGTIDSYMIRWLDRTLGLADRDFLIPTVSGGSESYQDSLIG